MRFSDQAAQQELLLVLLNPALFFMPAAIWVGVLQTQDKPLSASLDSSSFKGFPLAKIKKA